MGKELLSYKNLIPLMFKATKPRSRRVLLFSRVGVELLFTQRYGHLGALAGGNVYGGGVVVVAGLGYR